MDKQSSLHLPTAKRRQQAQRKGLYNYYAAYSSLFVEEAIRHLDAYEGALVMDPWNGSGTTTKVAASLGYRAVGYDLNPAMTVIAKAGMIDATTVFNSVGSLSQTIIKTAGHIKVTSWDLEQDLLRSWFTLPTVTSWRRLERSISRHLVTKQKDDYPIPTDEISLLAAFFYVALFCALKEYLKHSKFACSNPTWIKIAKTGEEEELPFTEIKQLFLTEVENLRKGLSAEVRQKKSTFTSDTDIRLQHNLRTANSLNLPQEDNSVDLVITSPPYCTRIDYAVATRPELALLGYSLQEFKDLRSQMMGTTTVNKSEYYPNKNWGELCLKTLQEIKSHHSVASDTYYIRNLSQYFYNLYGSLKEIDRTLKSEGRCAIVVQDSYYKNIHIDLPQVVQEMGESMGWEKSGISRFEVLNSMAGINRRSAPYRSKTRISESAVFFTKSTF